jgi:hypothetical protein
VNPALWKEAGRWKPFVIFRKNGLLISARPSPSPPALTRACFNRVMTKGDSKGDSRKEALLGQGDVSPDTENLSSEEMAQMGAAHGRGGQSVDGADPTDEQLSEHVSGDNQPGAKNAEDSRDL